MSQLLPNDPAANQNQRAPGLSLPGNLGVNNSPYPYVDFFQSRSGNWWRYDETPGNIGYAHGHVSGTYEEKNPLSGTTALTVNCHSHYVGAGSTATSEANHDSKLGGSHVNRVAMDHYAEHGSDMMHAIGGDVIHAVNGIHFQHATGGTQITSAGDHATDHNDGSHHTNINTDDIKYIGGVKYVSVGSDYGVHCPNGSFDVNVSNNYNINANSQCTIHVGSTVITILPNSVIVHDGNGNEVGMNSSKMWVGNPGNSNIPVYLGGNGQNASLYSPVSTVAGPSINVQAKFQSGQG